MSLFTIGHSNQSQEEFLKLLNLYNIDYVLDVRSTPYSQYTCQFNKDVINEFLCKNGIKYYPMGAYFGARQSDRGLYNEDGYLDFEKTRESEQFIIGQNSVLKGLELGHRIALMCTEKDPFDCHRAIMVARSFELIPVCVSHIHLDGHLETQKELNDRLIDHLETKTGVDTQQFTMFQEQKSKEEWLVDAYRLRNREIAYRMEME